MNKLAERIKDDLMKEIDEFKDELMTEVEMNVRETGSCIVSLFCEKFESGWESASMSHVRVPKRYAFYVENEYTFQGFKVDKIYTPAGNLCKFRIHL